MSIAHYIQGFENNLTANCSGERFYCVFTTVGTVDMKLKQNTNKTVSGLKQNDVQIK